MMFYSDSTDNMKDDNTPAVPQNRIISTLMSGHSSTRNEGQKFVLKSEPGFAARSNQVFDNLKTLEDEHGKRNDEEVDPTHFQKADPPADDVIDSSGVFKKPKGFAPKRKKSKEESNLEKFAQTEKKQKCYLPGATGNAGRSNISGSMSSLDGSKSTAAVKTADSPRKTVFHVLGNNSNSSPAAFGGPGSSHSRQHLPVIVPRPGALLNDSRKKKKNTFYAYDTPKKSRLIPSTLVADTYVPKRIRPTLISPEVSSRVSVQKKMTSPKKRQARTSPTPTSSIFARPLLGSAYLEQRAAILKKIHVHPWSSSEKDREKPK